MIKKILLLFIIIIIARDYRMFRHNRVYGTSYCPPFLSGVHMYGSSHSET